MQAAGIAWTQVGADTRRLRPHHSRSAAYRFNSRADLLRQLGGEHAAVLVPPVAQQQAVALLPWLLRILHLLQACIQAGKVAPCGSPHVAPCENRQGNSGYQGEKVLQKQTRHSVAAWLDRTRPPARRQAGQQRLPTVRLRTIALQSKRLPGLPADDRRDSSLRESHCREFVLWVTRLVREARPPFSGLFLE